ncbi:MAG: DMT family transporter [Rhodobacteraceae bacterium]|nr:DMT family transporter [Paracoccaceae bacterium]
MQFRTSQNSIGIGWMVVAGLNFVVVTAIVKHVGSGVPPAQAAFLRYVLGLVFLLPMIRPIRNAGLNRKLMILLSWRSAAHAGGVILWFYAMTKISMTEVTAMNYLMPVYVTIGAAAFLGEKLAYRRVLAVLAALVGAFMILRPGFREISPGHIAMLGTAVFFAVSFLLAKRLTDDLAAPVIVGMLSITVPIALIPLAAADWISPSWSQLFWLFLVAAFATAGHYTMTLAFHHAPVSTTQPAIFLQLVWAALLGFFVFGEAIEFWVLAGGTVIIASVCFIAWREAMPANRARRTLLDSD